LPGIRVAIGGVANIPGLHRTTEGRHQPEEIERIGEIAVIAGKAAEPRMIKLLFCSVVIIEND
jgi:hypothetical protein